MINFILGLVAGLLGTIGLEQGANDSPWLFTLSIIIILIVCLYLLFNLWQYYNKNKGVRLENKIKKAEVKNIKNKNNKEKENDNKEV